MSRKAGYAKWHALFYWLRSKGLVTRPLTPDAMCSLAEAHLGIISLVGSGKARLRIIEAAIGLKGEALATAVAKSFKAKAEKPKKANPTLRRQSQDRAKRFYQSAEWKRARYDVLREANGRCQLCGLSAADGAVLNVDHIRPLRDYWALRLDKENLQCLCGSCNAGKGNRYTDDWRQLDREFNAAMDRDAS